MKKAQLNQNLYNEITIIIRSKTEEKKMEKWKKRKVNLIFFLNFQTWLCALKDFLSFTVGWWWNERAITSYQLPVPKLLFSFFVFPELMAFPSVYNILFHRTHIAFKNEKLNYIINLTEIFAIVLGWISTNSNVFIDLLTLTAVSLCILSGFMFYYRKLIEMMS